LSKSPSPDQPRFEATTIADVTVGSPTAGRLFLVVVGDEVSATYPLPTVGEVSIGRAESSDVRIDHPSISRQHALVTVGPGITIRDLGSANGTRVRGERLESGAPVTISPGEAVDLGSTMLLVQRRTAPIRARRLRTHSYFEGRLDDECTRADRASQGFAVARVHCAPEISLPVVEATLVSVLQPEDIVACYAAGEYEILFVAAGATEASRRLDKAAEKLRALDEHARVGLASYPRDGRTPYALLAQARIAARGVPEEGESSSVVVRDPAMEQLYRMVERVAPGTISVLLLGETGVGKEVVAKAVHRSSPRASKPCLRLNCAALSESLLESELFGHEKGSFTGATQAKPGLLETAAGGTVFLDEVGELPPSIQAKLLRALEEREVLRVGGLKPTRIDVRFVAATNRDLESNVAAGSFRQDLFYRLNGVTLVIPPLRERTAEIEPLARAFAEQAAREVGRPAAPEIGDDVLALLLGYSWPGNIREVRNVMERAVLLCTGDRITAEHLPLERMRAAPSVKPAMGVPAEAASAPAAVSPAPAVAPSSDAAATQPGPAFPPGSPEEEERQRIVDALAASGGNQTRAAEILGYSRRTLSKRLDKFGFPRPRKGRG